MNCFFVLIQQINNRSFITHYSNQYTILQQLSNRILYSVFNFRPNTSCTSLTRIFAIVGFGKTAVLRNANEYEINIFFLFEKTNADDFENYVDSNTHHTIHIIRISSVSKQVNIYVQYRI